MKYQMSYLKFHGISPILLIMLDKTSIIPRNLELEGLKKLIHAFPATAILGARQCGKTTLARYFDADHYFDLEDPGVLSRFENPKLTLEGLAGLIVIDEIQRAPELFPLLRYLIDNHPDQKYLILGSASRDLIQQSSESLAGRIAYFHLGGFRIDDVGLEHAPDLWLRGGFPRSFLAVSDEESLLWRKNYISTFLERDIPQLGIRIPAATLRRFWIMLSHYHGQTLNFSELARSFGISDMTVRRYVEILQDTLMVRLLQPWHTNTRKRLVKSPKLYIRDSGLLHSLLTIESSPQLMSHNKLGASWEGFALESMVRALDRQDNEVFFWGTHGGAELDLFFQSAGRSWGIEFKHRDAPKLTRSMRVALEDLSLEHLWVVYPGKEPYPLHQRVSVVPFASMREIYMQITGPPQ